MNQISFRKKWMTACTVFLLLGLSYCVPPVYTAQKQTAILDDTQSITSAPQSSSQLVLQYDLNAIFTEVVLTGLSLLLPGIILVTTIILAKTRLLSGFFLGAAIIGWLFALIPVGLSIYNLLRPKASITCDADKVTIEDTVILLQDIAFVKIDKAGCKIRIHMKDASGIYTLEHSRMKNLGDMLKFLDFLKDKGVAIKYVAR